jgi:hypothetical protein
MSGVARRVLGGLAAWVVVLGVARLVIAQPEQCGPVDAPKIEHAVTEAVAWAERTQDGNGRWIYRYDAENDRDVGMYEMVRHAGLMMALFQAQEAGFPVAGDVADRALAYAQPRLLEHGDWTALAGDDKRAWVGTGASALFAAGLVYRRDATGDVRYDDLLRGLGRFLSSVVEPTGAVPEFWDPVTGQNVPGRYSPFFTGESFCALTMLHLRFPGEGFDVPARRIAHYLASVRDDAEDRFPDVPDHWAAYGLATMTKWPGETLDPELLKYARKVAELESMQVRFDSQRTNSWWSRLTRGEQGLGAGVGTIGEALTMLRQTPELDTPPVRERGACAISLLLQRQTTASKAASYPNPSRVQGAWLRSGMTQIDDQQHPMSALLDLLTLLRAGRPVT